MSFYNCIARCGFFGGEISILILGLQCLFPSLRPFTFFMCTPQKSRIFPGVAYPNVEHTILGVHCILSKAFISTLMLQSPYFLLWLRRTDLGIGKKLTVPRKAEVERSTVKWSEWAEDGEYVFCKREMRCVGRNLSSFINKELFLQLKVI